LINNRCAACFKLLLTLVSVFITAMTSDQSAVYGADTGPVPTDFKASIAWVAEKNIPAVVHIDVTERQEVTLPFQPFENDPFFRYFFNAPQMPRKYKREVQGLGTGMIMDAKGHILTNNHVVGGASKIQVLLANGRRYPATLVGTDPKTDLAVIKISAKESLPFVTFGDSDKTKVGDWVVAIGHPRGLDQTVTQGIISAKHRQGIMEPSSYQDFLQTDAAINPGNSGGPLLNLKGEVIGVNAAIVSQSGGYEGIGFAIPSNMALYIAQALIGRGRVERGWLGVSVQDLSPELAKSFNMDIAKGALIADVVKDGPAEKAGLKRGDVVIAYKGIEIPDARTFLNRASGSPIGENVRLTILRDGVKKEITVIIVSMQQAAKALAASLKDRLGADVRAVSQREVKKYRLDSSQGVVVVWLERRGPLAAAGFEVGDIIFEINGQAIESAESFIDQVSALPPRQPIALLALDHRTGNGGYVQVMIR
jgi:serine protease Do